MPFDALTPADVAELDARGISRDEAERQLALLRSGLAPTRLLRPCTVGDGIVRPAAADRARLATVARDAARDGRVGWFVPASGAATRMFKDLLATPPEPAALRRLIDNLPRFAFHGELARLLAGDTTPERVVAALLSPDGLGYAQLPKGVLAFHLQAGGPPLTALDEQLLEAALLVGDAAGTTRVHITISPEHAARFEQAVAAHRAAHPERRLEVRFSTQDRATDTLAVDADGRIVRTAEGRLLFRPAGHGALLGNLAAAGASTAEILFLKNIDNVAAAPHKQPTFEHARTIIGTLVELAQRTHVLLARLDAGEATAAEEARRFARETFARDVPADPAALRDALDRPLRVCGMVPNTGEPGGGPFWVAAPDGTTSVQIVESAQVDLADPEQQRLFADSTHFNPVFLACVVRDRHGAPYDLDRFVDPRAAIVTRKSSGGRELVALERPGLWNGAMAGWNTVFVEVPGEVFNPVKTVLDLLRPAHQPAGQ